MQFPGNSREFRPLALVYIKEHDWKKSDEILPEILPGTFFFTPSFSPLSFILPGWNRKKILKINISRCIIIKYEEI
jgi:hypothetical protein